MPGTARPAVWGEEGKPTQQMIQTALRLAPEAAPVHDSLTQYHIFRGEWEKGVAVLQQFVEQHPLNPNGWYYYAQYLFHTGDASAAAEAILKAHALYPKDCEIYRALCDVIGAMQIYQTTLSQPLLYPVHREVKEALKRLQTITGKDSYR